MKMCRTIYRALFKVAPELAKKTFIAHAAFYVRPPSPFSSLTKSTAPNCPQDDCQRPRRVTVTRVKYACRGMMSICCINCLFSIHHPRHSYVGLHDLAAIPLNEPASVSANQ